jgi:hypothetical protein
MNRELPFAAWTPDQVGAAVQRVVNMLPVPDGWGPFPLPSRTSTVGLTGTPTMLAAVRSASGIDYIFAATRTTVYRASANSWVALDDDFDAVTPWQIVPYGDTAYLCNGRSPIQKIELTGASSVDAVPDLPNDLGSRYLAQVADVIMAAWIVENGVNQRPYRTQWTGVGRPEKYTPNTATQADFQDHTDIGELRGLTGGEFCLIHGADGLIRGDYVGPPNVFEFRTLETDVGLEYPGSLASSSGRAYWWSKSGFRFSGGGPSQAIGYGQVDEFFRARLRKDFADRISAAVFPEQQTVLWLYPGPDGYDGTPTECLAFNYALQRWGFGQFRAQVLGRGKTVDRFTDDPLYGDTLTDDQDGNTDDGADFQPFGAVISGGALCRLVPLTSTVCEIETGELRLSPGYRSRVTRAWPLVEASPTLMRLNIHTRERQDSNELSQVSPALTREDTGSIPCDDAGMLHRFNLRWSGFWRKARGLAVEFHPQGMR